MATMPTPVFTVYHNDGKTEVYVLQPGEHFPRFGGSSRGLTVHKTPSIITRDITPFGVRDVERSVSDPNFWNWIVRVINDKKLEASNFA